jgi:iron complex outermembrane recepter protein
MRSSRAPRRETNSILLTKDLFMPNTMLLSRTRLSETALSISRPLFLALVVLAAPAHAQSASNPDDGTALGEVVVTAQKRTDLLSEVPLSIDVVTSDQIRTLGISSAADLEKLVPGYTYRESPAGVPSPTIRGIGFYDNSIGINPTVSTYIDEAPLPYAAMMRGAVLDLARVEVLKGPQGTLFGQNSTGGAINYISAKPTDTPQAGIEATYGRFNEAQLEGYASGPLSPTLSARVSGRIESQGDWQEDYTRDDSIGRKRFYNGRLLLDWTPADGTALVLNVSGWRDRSDDQIPQYRLFNPLQKSGGFAGGYALATYPAAPDNDRAADWTPGENYARNDSFFHTALRGDINIAEHLNLTSLTSYSDLSVNWPTDGDGTALVNQSSDVEGRIRSFSQELRLAGTLSRGMTWLVGGNYEHDRLHELDDYVLQTTTASAFGVDFDGLNVHADQRVSTTAAFASTDIPLTPTLTAQLGLRDTHETRTFQGCAADNGDGTLASAFSVLSSALTGTSQTIAPGSCVTIGPSGIAGIVNSVLSQDNLSSRGALGWKPRDGVLFYASVTKGYKSGGYSTLLAPFAGQYAPATQESVLAYETGFKLEPTRTVRLNGAAFYLDYRDKQLLGTIDLGAFGRNAALVNIPKSRVWGLELEAVAEPLRGLRLTAGGTYVNSRVESDPLAPVDAEGNPTTYIGNAFPDTPRWQAIGDVQYDFPLTDRLTGFVGGNAQYRSGAFGSLGQSPIVRIDGYTLLDLRAGIADAAHGWRLTFWGRNVTNVYYWTNAFNSGDANTRFTGAPVTYGITGSLTF